MPVKFLAEADKHKVPRRSSLYVVLTARPQAITTNRGKSGTLFVGKDDRGVELEVITVGAGPRETIIHSMPVNYRHKEDS
ncbi:MAG: hypothetical protein LBI84_06060 [Propionibacteriaceae bacterium]|jgi:hypothetical protein|nr:hypothetical protein [Propionibacteriaceae bacterium]